jgi:hypothetical protein
MIVVIQCQGRKQPNAGRLRTVDGRPVCFVAQPALAPFDTSYVYARPDDVSDDGVSWRKKLLEYNADARNPYGLYPAYRLYADNLYRRLADHCGLQNLYILSAGWGLIRADFLTPYYDITFSATKPEQKYKRRRPSDDYSDFAMLPPHAIGKLVFFGSSAYVGAFCHLTKNSLCEKIVFYKTGEAPEARGCVLRKFENAKRDTNWQYDCASAFLDANLRI